MTVEGFNRRPCSGCGARIPRTANPPGAGTWRRKCEPCQEKSAPVSLTDRRQRIDDATAKAHAVYPSTRWDADAWLCVFDVYPHVFDKMLDGIGEVVGRQVKLGLLRIDANGVAIPVKRKRS